MEQVPAMATGPQGGTHRSFYQLPPADGAGGPGRPADAEPLRQYVRQQTIGRDRSFLGPFGPNRAVYCDYTASGKSLRFIEDYIRDEVLPTYANTHTTSTHSALQTTSFRDEARLMVRNSVQASEHDAVLFCGTGSTAAVHKLISLLHLPRPPTVLVGPHEHHSNLLPWREVAAQVVRVAEDPVTGAVSLPDLEARLAGLSSTERPLVACFSAASNVTGLLAADAEITAAVHRHGGLAVWDYATAGPYTKVAMNPVLAGLDAGLTQKDALFLSPHKMIGGVQTPGVLVVKKKLVKNSVPDCGGGGTVFFVRREHHRYLQDIETREEGGTPGIVESVRAGLVLQLKEALGPEQIRLWDDSIVSRFLRETRAMPQLVLLGPRAVTCPRLPVFSFLVVTPSGAFLHYNFVASLLNDLFGVQTRGGCACAGPYAQDLLGIDDPLAARYEDVLTEDSRLDRTHLRRQGEYSSYELLRPGFTRVTLSYLLSDDELDHVITALRIVSERGWQLLPQYRVNPETGEWRHHSNMVLKERRWLGDIRYTTGRMEYRQRATHTAAPDLTACAARAVTHIDNARKNCPHQVPDHRAMFGEEAAKLRWFLLPNEAKLMLHGTAVALSSPFRPRVYGSGSQSRPALGRRRALSESNESAESARASRSPAPVTPPPPTAPPTATYAGSLDRDRERGRPPAPASASASQRTPTRAPYLKQRAMSVSCGADRRLSDTRFLAQELANLFASGTRSEALRQSSAAAAADRRRSPDGAETRPRHTRSESEATAAVTTVAVRRAMAVAVVRPVRSEPDPLPAPPPAQPTQASPASRSEQTPPPARGVVSSVSGDLREDLAGRHHLTGAVTAGGARPPSAGAGRSASPLSDISEQTAGDSGAALVRGAAPAVSTSCSTKAADGCALNTDVGGASSVRDEGVSRSCVGHAVAVPAVMDNNRAEASRNANSAAVNSCTPKMTDRMMSNDISNVKSSSLASSSVVSSKCSDQMHSSEIKPEISDEVDSSKLKTSSDKVDTGKCSTPKVSDVNSDNSMPNSNPEANDKVVQPINKSAGQRGDSRSLSISHVVNRDSNKLKTGDHVKRSDNTKLETSGKAVIGEGGKPKTSESPHNNSAPLVKAAGTEVSGPKWHAPPRSIYKKAAEAMDEFDMLRPGDRVLVCLSGGKDSLSLLHVLHQHQFVAASRAAPFQLAAVTVDPQSSAYDPRPLVPYLAKLGVPYFYEVQGILQQAEQVDCSSICSFCSRMKRGRLYAAARRQGYNVLAFGQHLDDISESFLMSVFHNGRLRTMKACYTVKEEDLRVIRPLIYVREKELRQFAESRKLPVIPENCPACFEEPKERHRVKQLLAQQEVLFPHLFESLRTAMRPLYAISRTGLESRLFGRAPADDDASDDEDGRAGRRGAADPCAGGAAT